MPKYETCGVCGGLRQVAVVLPPVVKPYAPPALPIADVLPTEIPVSGGAVTRSAVAFYSGVHESRKRSDIENSVTPPVFGGVPDKCIC